MWHSVELVIFWFLLNQFLIEVLRVPHKKIEYCTKLNAILYVRKLLLESASKLAVTCSGLIFQESLCSSAADKVRHDKVFTPFPNILV